MGISQQIKPNIPQQAETVLGLLDRAAEDSVLLQALATDVLDVARAAGVRISAADLKTMLGIPEATDRELVEVLRARLNQAQGASCGCGA